MKLIIALLSVTFATSQVACQNTWAEFRDVAFWDINKIYELRDIAVLGQSVYWESVHGFKFYTQEVNPNLEIIPEPTLRKLKEDIHRQKKVIMDYIDQLTSVVEKDFSSQSHCSVFFYNLERDFLEQTLKFESEALDRLTNATKYCSSLDYVTRENKFAFDKMRNQTIKDYYGFSKNQYKKLNDSLRIVETRIKEGVNLLLNLDKILESTCTPYEDPDCLQKCLKDSFIKEVGNVKAYVANALGEILNLPREVNQIIENQRTDKIKVTDKFIKYLDERVGNVLEKLSKSRTIC